MRRLRLTGWETIVALAAGITSAIFMPSDFYNDGIAEIVTVIGFLMAAFIPAMVLGATALRAGNFSVKRLRSISGAIDRQIAVFGGLFLYALMACVIAVMGKLLKWTLPALSTGRELVPTIPLGQLLPAALTYALVLLILRSIRVIAAVRSILHLSTTIAEDEARARDKPATDAAVDELDDYQMPPGYGSRIELPH
ncbi:hypothetical protein [Microvirga puerhi]|uniref:TRAP transporter small permease n=1 Tax=Microvirga puerhi TaxID=2876078 RepID=A0ABS7VVK8_9HYPH|nr:hypothetical protein [Microvirga puerhi]MBZ6079186.1 hypothetical protein [Microvirga puerhi]